MSRDGGLTCDRIARVEARRMANESLAGAYAQGLLDGLALMRFAPWWATRVLAEEAALCERAGAAASGWDELAETARARAARYPIRRRDRGDRGD